jgi:3'(2'), 5'-bisphosphate nucleotidase
MNAFNYELEIAKEIAREAGKILLLRANDSFNIGFKEDKSVVSQVDKEVSEFITASLIKSFPKYGILDEENPFDLRKKHRLCWVVDPLDGTIEYVNKREVYGVMIGLMKDFMPILGVVYKPVVDEMVYAVKGQGAFLDKSGLKRRINVSDSDKLVLLISKNRRNSELNKIITNLNPTEVIEMPSSFKITEVAKGNATRFICSPSTTMNLWDLCSQQIILEEAGGTMSDYYGNKINYSGDLVNRLGIIASNKNSLRKGI